MSQLDILIPFGLPPKELANDLFRGLNAPALAMLLGRAKRISSQETAEDGFSRTLPHENWLASQYGLASPSGTNSSPCIALALMRAFGLGADAGFWFVVNPVHFHIARDHLVLTDPRQLALSTDEARALFDLAQTLFAEDGKTLLYGDASTWFLRADDWSELHTSTPDAASGRNIDIWMPHGKGERDWRKLQNEVQMHWFNSEVNAERESRGLKPVNSIWLWGGAPAALSPGAVPYNEIFGLTGWGQALHPTREADANTALATAHGLAILDSLLGPALTNDWGTWQLALSDMESEWFAPLLEALKAGKLRQLNMIFTDQIRFSSFSIDKRSLYGFWRKPSLTPLLA